MENEKNIMIEECCRYYNIEVSFVHSLSEYGLIELQQTNETYFIHPGELSRLEKYMHLYYDLDINIPGIEAIAHLLARVENLQAEIRRLGVPPYSGEQNI